MKKLKGIADHLRLIADQLEHGVTKNQANEINDELDQLTYVIDAELNPKKGGK